MKKEAPKSSPVLQGAFICIHVAFISFIFPSMRPLLQDTIGYWDLITGIAALIIAAIVGALVTCFADAKQLKVMCLLQGIAILLYAICKILPQVEPDFEWSQVPPAIEKMARSSFLMCFVILFCILGFVALLVIKAMPYVTGIVAMVSAQDAGETNQAEMPEDDDWAAEALDHLRHENVSTALKDGADTEDTEESEDANDQTMRMIRWLHSLAGGPEPSVEGVTGEAIKEGKKLDFETGSLNEREMIYGCALNDYFRQLPPGTTYDELLGAHQTETNADKKAAENAASDQPLAHSTSEPSAQQKFEESEKLVQLEKPKKAKKTQGASEAKKAKKQAKKIAKLERKIAERDRQIFCTKWYLRALNLCVAISCGVVLLMIFSLIQLIPAGSDAARTVWDSARTIIGYQQLSLVAQLVLKVVCRAIGAPTDKEELKTLRKEQKQQKRALKAWRAR